MKSVRFAKPRANEEIPWVRIDDFPKLRLSKARVLINGAFDLLHAGHRKIINVAAKHGTVICALDSDRWVAERKGPDRPILTWIERAVSLNYLPIDYIVEIDNDGDFKRLVEVLEPTLRVQGAEYSGYTSRCPDIPKLLVHAAGMRTTELIRRIRGTS